MGDEITLSTTTKHDYKYLSPRDKLKDYKNMDQIKKYSFWHEKKIDGE